MTFPKILSFVLSKLGLNGSQQQESADVGLEPKRKRCKRRPNGENQSLSITLPVWLVDNIRHHAAEMDISVSVYVELVLKNESCVVYHPVIATGEDATGCLE
jgi:hypothetical protein